MEEENGGSMGGGPRKAAGAEKPNVKMNKRPNSETLPARSHRRQSEDLGFKYRGEDRRNNQTQAKGTV